MDSLCIRKIYNIMISDQIPIFVKSNDELEKFKKVKIKDIYFFSVSNNKSTISVGDSLIGVAHRN